jgi:hypothetical protein
LFSTTPLFLFRVCREVFNLDQICEHCPKVLDSRWAHESIRRLQRPRKTARRVAAQDEESGVMSFETASPAVTHAEFMEIFWFCDTETTEERKATKSMTDEEIDEKSPIARRLAILSKIHEVLFGVPTNGCKVVDDIPPSASIQKSERSRKKTKAP